MELFAEQVKFDSNGNVDLISGTSLDQNFDTFLWGFTTVFVLLTQDSWSGLYQSYFLATGYLKSTLYYITFQIIGPRILLNLFVAILLRNFDDDTLELE